MQPDQDQARDLARTYAEAWCSHDPAAVADHYTPGGTIAINGGEPTEITEVASSFMSAFPDIQVFVDDVVFKEDTVELHWTFTGTNTGPGGTGKWVRISGFEEWRFGDDGLVAESQGHYDQAEYDRQLEHGAAEDVSAPMVTESKLEKTEYGLVPKDDGWFVLGMREAVWRHAEGRGAVCVALDDFEGERQTEQLGVNPFVLMPGEPMAVYHWETDQEDFLVVSGEAVLIVEGEERHLRAWDFVHCPPNTKHVIVGAGSGPCLVIAVGAREHSAEPGSLGFAADEVAKRYGASVDKDTMDPEVAYDPLPLREPTAYRNGWLPE